MSSTILNCLRWLLAIFTRKRTRSLQEEQTSPVTEKSIVMASQNSVFLDRVHGTIYGNCIGDAIGLLTEFMNKEEANYWYSDYPKLTYDLKEVLQHQCHQSRWKTGDWTDDSDQMILIMQSLIDNKGEVVPTDFAKKMRKWAKEGFKELGDKGGLGIGMTTYRVISDKRFIKDPHQVAHDVWDSSGRYLAPNGALMRTSILGIYQYEDIDKVIQNTLAMCKTTHADPRCKASCVALTTALAIILQGKKHRGIDSQVVVPGVIEASFHFAKGQLETEKERNELFYYMNITNIEDLQLDEHDKIGYTYKCLGAAFWAFKQNDFEEALTAIVREAGDADTNGAVAGALLGCKLGYNNLPTKWREELLHRQWLDEKVEKFLELVKIPENEADKPKEVEKMEVDGVSGTAGDAGRSDTVMEPEDQNISRQNREATNSDVREDSQEKAENGGKIKHRGIDKRERKKAENQSAEKQTSDDVWKKREDTIEKTMEKGTDTGDGSPQTQDENTDVADTSLSEVAVQTNEGEKNKTTPLLKTQEKEVDDGDTTITDPTEDNAEIGDKQSSGNTLEDENVVGSTKDDKQTSEDKTTDDTTQNMPQTEAGAEDKMEIGEEQSVGHTPEADAQKLDARNIVGATKDDEQPSADNTDQSQTAAGAEDMADKEKEQSLGDTPEDGAQKLDGENVGGTAKDEDETTDTAL